MSRILTVEGDPLNAIWTPYANDVGQLTNSSFFGRAKHVDGIPDAYVSMIAEGLYETGVSVQNSSTWLQQFASPLRIYSVERFNEPYLCFSARLQFNFLSSASQALVTLTNVNDATKTFVLSGSTAGLAFGQGGISTPFPPAAQAYIATLTSNSLLTSVFDFYLCARCLDEVVVGINANYTTMAFVGIGSTIFEVWTATQFIPFQQRYQVSFASNTTFLYTP